MSDPSHSFQHDEIDYDRPSQKWTCGHSASGKSCPLGPSDCGACQGTGECLPLKKGDRWLCTRPASRGGCCADGPTTKGGCGCRLAPCQPIRSLRSRRGQVTMAVGLFTVGFLLILVARRPEGSGLHSGPLTQVHAGDNLSCASCHTSTELSEIHNIADPEFRKERAVRNSRLCLECHEQEIGKWEDSARFAHGWSPERVMAEQSERSSSEEEYHEIGLWLAGQVTSTREKGTQGELACATCHQEHHGAQASLVHLTNEQCQVCHQEQFESFSHGHPDFASTGYPYSRRTRLFFDHESHYGKHFAEGSDVAIEGYDPVAPYASGASCAKCHEPDVKGEYMLVKGFETSCADCHDETVKGGDPITFFSTPDSEYRDLPAMALLKGDGSQSDLLEEIWEEGNGVLTDRLAANGFAQTGLLDGLSVDSVRSLIFPGEDWDLAELSLPALDLGRLNAHLRPKGRSIGLWPSGAVVPLTPLTQHLLRDRPGAVEALATLRSRIGEEGTLPLDDLNEATPIELDAVESLAWELKSLFTELESHGAPYLEQFVALRGGVLKANRDPKAVLDQVFLTAKDDVDFAEGLSHEMNRRREGEAPLPVAAVLSKSTEALVAASGGDDDFGLEEEDDFGAPDEEDDFGEAESEPEEKEVVSRPKIFTEPDPREWQTQGGWFVENRALHYQSRGHADPVLRAWIESSVEAINRKTPGAQEVLTQTLGWKNGVLTDASGQCFQCHVIDRDPDSGLSRINWRGANATKASRNPSNELTRFSHSKHFIALDCITCHVPDRTSKGYANFFPARGKKIANHDPSRFQSNFLPVNKQVSCATCHEKAKAGNSCLQCHEYHAQPQTHTKPKQ